MGAVSNGRLQFGEFELDPSSGELFRDGRPVKIQPQPLRVLSVLLERPGEIVSRDQLRARIWGQATFVEFDQGLNYAIRQIRLALRDEASEPRYIETLPKQGYRLIAGVVPADRKPASEPDFSTTPPSGLNGTHLQAEQQTAPRRRKHLIWLIPASILIVLAIAGIVAYRYLRPRSAEIKYTQLTDFTDSAVAPALSPDGHMVAFIRGGENFISADPIYVKVLPNGEPRRVTDDPRPKYNLAFSPDGSEIAYTVMDTTYFSTYTVSVLGGDSHLLMKNAAGLSWLNQNQLLYSEFRGGIHLGVVTSDASRAGLREIYFPPHERSMAHYTYPSPDRRWALVVEMDEIGNWGPCRLIALQPGPAPRPIGPAGPCLSAGWSPDGAWMYFTATIEGRSHLWRQRFPGGLPEQITNGPAEEEGVAVEQSGKSIITSVGVRQSAIWFHGPEGDRQLSSEGEIAPGMPAAMFSRDDKILYYLLHHGSQGSGAELWQTAVDTGKSEAVFPGVSMLAFDVSADGKEVVYSAASPNGETQLWLAAIDKTSPAARVGAIRGTWPHFGANGQILFQLTEGSSNYLERVNMDGSGLSRVVPFTISEILDVSPGGRWVIAPVPDPPGGNGPVLMAIPLDGSPPRRLCHSYCEPIWSSSGDYLFIPVESASSTSPGRGLAIPVGPGESLPPFPPLGIEAGAPASVVPGSQSIPRQDLVPGRDPAHYAYVNTTVHRNLYRISLP